MSQSLLIQKHQSVSTVRKRTIAVPEAAGKRPDQLKPGEKIRWLQLSQPFEAWVIDDRKISHHVEEIALGPDGATAERDILLIDFLPQASKLSDDL